MNYLPVKSAGRTVMTSDFVNVLDGFVRYKDDVWEELKQEENVKADIKKMGEECARRAGSILDVSKDGYYNAPKCTTDFEKVSLIILVSLPSSTFNICTRDCSFIS